MTKHIDAMGKPCPQPVILAKQALDAIPEGVVTIEVDNETSAANLTKFAKNMGAVPETKKENDRWIVTIKKEAGQETPAEDTIQCDPFAAAGPVRALGIGSARMGHGADELGDILMKSLIYTVSQTEPLPEAILFFNGGVHLTVAGSPVLEDLQQMEEKGVQIISCGTCLDYFNKKEALQVGEVSNMYTIYETLREKNALVLD